MRYFLVRKINNFTKTLSLRVKVPNTYGARLYVLMHNVTHTSQYLYLQLQNCFSTSVQPVLVPMMIMGGILLVVGLVGCCGACSQKSGLLNVYFIVILVCVVAELIILIYGKIPVFYSSDFLDSKNSLNRWK